MLDADYHAMNLVQSNRGRELEFRIIEGRVAQSVAKWEEWLSCEESVRPACNKGC